MELLLEPLNLPHFTFKVKDNGTSRQIYDCVRKQYVALTPEEWVRQHLIRFMTDVHAYPASMMAVEKLVNVNQLKQRADIVVYNKNGLPWLIAECKAPYVTLSTDTFYQAARYNSRLGASFLVISNGKEHFCIRVSESKIVCLDKFPEYNTI